MPDYGVIRQGFRRKRLSDILEQKRQRAGELFADLVPPGEVVDTSDSSLLGRLILLDSPGDAELWEELQQVYLAFDPNSATGLALDNLVALAGIQRMPEQPTTADVYLYGDIYTTILFDSEVRSPATSTIYTLLSAVHLDNEMAHGVGVTVFDAQPNTEYTLSYTLAGGTVFTDISITTGATPTTEGVLEEIKGLIDNNHDGLTSYIEDGILYVESAVELQLMTFYTSYNMAIVKAIGVGRVVATEAGPIEETPSAINSISTPVFGWDRVVNPFQATTGTNRETDEELRERFRNSKFQRATNIIESLYSALYSVTGVTSITIYENDTDVVDELGLPPHSFWVVVDGGLDSEVARAIWLNRPAGIQSQGNTLVSILDSFGYSREVRFGRPESVQLYIRMTLTTNQNFPPDGGDQIKANLTEYIDSLEIGQDVVYSRLYTPINRVVGHQVDTLEISTDGSNWQTTNIEVGVDEKATLADNNISIT